jgi:malonate-semialdehyde dehydrogenase (acetylating) / methylmalonate-semialdehyde dehydrogenase
VMPDCDLEDAVEAMVGSAFGSAGQRCMAGSVAVVVEPGDTLLTRLRERAAALKIGPGDTPGCELGPLINASQRDRVLSYIDIGVQEGASLVLDGRDKRRQEGFFIGATIFDHVTPTMRIAREEIFGPVLSVVRARDLAEALTIVNASTMGNGAVLFTRDAAVVRRFVADVEAGMIGVNVGVPAPYAVFPFSGWKGSFFGDLHAHGKDGVRFYTEQKVVTSRYR